MIFGLSEGRIVEQGTHDELLPDPEGLYARLHVEQFTRHEPPEGDVPL